MPQFRFQAISPNGKLVQGEFEADSKKIARAKVDRLIRTKNLKSKGLEIRKKFRYKVKKGSGPVIAGEQEAYSREEVERALLKLGYSVVKIEKIFIDLQGGVPKSEVVTFIRLSADLLRQKLPYDQILDLLYEDTPNKRMKETIKTIQKDLKDGKEGLEVYAKHEDIFGKFACYMLGVASTSGNMALVFESTAKFMERDATFRKNMRRALMMPSITVLAVIGVVLFYVGYIFPATAEMFLKFDIQLPPMTAATLDFSHWLQAHWIMILFTLLSPILAFFLYIRTPRGKLLLDRFLIRLPFIGDLLHKTSIEIFSRVFYTLYSGSGQNIDVIRIAAEACRNSYMGKQIKDISIRMMLDEGKGLVESLQQSGVFTHTALSRFKLGAESGALKENAKQLADYYETQTTYKMDSVIDTINLFINLFIMVALVAITIISSEAAIIRPN